jgi:hypothetical protein
MSLRLAVFAATCLACANAHAAPSWTVETSGITYLVYGEPGKPLITIGCAEDTRDRESDETYVTVSASPGSKPGKDAIVLTIAHKGGTAKLKLDPVICGGETACIDRAEGEISHYDASVPTKRLAIDIAERGKALSIDAPGAKLSVQADETVFRKFAGLCRNW